MMTTLLLLAGAAVIAALGIVFVIALAAIVAVTGVAVLASAVILIRGRLRRARAAKAGQPFPAPPTTLATDTPIRTLLGDEPATSAGVSAVAVLGGEPDGGRAVVPAQRTSAENAASNPFAAGPRRPASREPDRRPDA